MSNRFEQIFSIISISEEMNSQVEELNYHKSREENSAAASGGNPYNSLPFNLSSQALSDTDKTSPERPINPME